MLKRTSITLEWKFFGVGGGGVGVEVCWFYVFMAYRTVLSVYETV